MEPPALATFLTNIIFLIFTVSNVVFNKQTFVREKNKNLNLISSKF